MIHAIDSTNAELLHTAAEVFRGAPPDDSFVADPGSVAFVAEVGGEILGWCWGYVLPRPDGQSMMLIYDLEVRPESRRQGIGRGLVTAMLETARERGASKAWLTTAHDNSPARALYSHLGGQPALHGESAEYWWDLSN